MHANIAIMLVAGWFLLNLQSKGAGEVHVALPAPRDEGTHSLESVLARRHSVRDYADAPLSLEDLAQLLWSAQGVTRADGGRTAPSAGGLYPLELYVVAGKVTSLEPGVYHYEPSRHRLRRHSGEDLQAPVARDALSQECVRDAAAVLVLTAVYARTERKYGKRAPRYVHMEAGHAAQNVCLQATALSLGAVPVGAFEDDAVHAVLRLPVDEEVLYLIPLGKVE